MAPATAGVVLGRYEVGEVLGRGGSATVHRARDRHTERAVALKLFAPGVDTRDRHRQRAEVRTLSRLDHPGLVRLLDAGTDDGRAYLVTDLVEGPTLAARLSEGPLPPAEVTELGARLADALAHIHAQGITHRDVKPANVLLDPGYGPRLADFGIARLVDSTRVTTGDAVVGTAAYMAPEQLRGGTVGSPTDVYALGLVLLEAVTGSSGWPGTGLEPVLARLTIPPRIPAEVPATLARLLEAMTDVAPARRPTAVQVAATLGVFGPDDGGGIRRTRRRAPGFGAVVAALGALAVAVGAAVVVVTSGHAAAAGGRSTVAPPTPSLLTPAPGGGPIVPPTVASAGVPAVGVPGAPVAEGPRPAAAPGGAAHTAASSAAAAPGGAGHDDGRHGGHGGGGSGDDGGSGHGGRGGSGRDG
jgi:eukaryotic-like serine/threonine-protein kinase